MARLWLFHLRTPKIKKRYITEGCSSAATCHITERLIFYNDFRKQWICHPAFICLHWGRSYNGHFCNLNYVIKWHPAFKNLLKCCSTIPHWLNRAIGNKPYFAILSNMKERSLTLPNFSEARAFHNRTLVSSEPDKMYLKLATIYIVTDYVTCSITQLLKQ